jgi:predicted RNase H-like nuclease
MGVVRRASYIGIDLAWAPRNPTGLAALVPGRNGLEVRAVELRTADDEIVDFVCEHAARTTVVMVDAPLVIRTRRRMRACDRLTHSLFGRQHAGAYPANRRNMGRYTGGVPRGEALGERLAEVGFPWPPGELPAPPLGEGRWLFECYPHPAQVVLFGLPTVLKYKKKRQEWAVARAEFKRYLNLTRALRRPAIRFERALLRELSAEGAVGRAYKAREDRLDAIFCAYLAALAAEGRLEMLGEPAAGSIVVPVRPPRRRRP